VLVALGPLASTPPGAQAACFVETLVETRQEDTTLQVVIENPILNSPAERAEPTRHFHFTDAVSPRQGNTGSQFAT
jgi:hypothetical protein